MKCTIRAMLLSAWAVAAPPAAAAQARDCTACHARESHEHASSAHARSLQPVQDSLFFQSLPDRPLGEARGGFLLEFRKHGRLLEVTAERELDRASAQIEWVFGAGKRAQTPVAFTPGGALELRLSYYTRPAKYDLTFGHKAGVSLSAPDAIGIKQSDKVMVKCFGCHSEGVPGSEGFRPGVQCASCHGASYNEKARHPSPSALSAKRAPLNQQAVLKVCGACHRTDPEGDPDDSVNVRYQAVRLKRSRCFQAGLLSCVTCHDPHADARTDPQWYRARCLECHGEEAHASKMAQTYCLPCHMPDKTITARLVFTDHWIRKP